jgi:hypothetical protein
MKKLLAIFLISVSITSLCHANTHDIVKAKLTDYISAQKMTLAQIKGFTETQVTNWSRNNYPKVDPKIVWNELQEIIRDKDKERIDSFVGNVLNTIKTYYPNAIVGL